MLVCFILLMVCKQRSGVFSFTAGYAVITKPSYKYKVYKCKYNPVYVESSTYLVQ